MIIDFNTSPFMIRELFIEDKQLEHAVKDIFGFYFPAQPLSIILDEMNAAGVDKSVILPIDCSTAHGVIIGKNEAISALAKKNSRMIGFASVDPHSKDSVQNLRNAVKNLNLRGLNLDPALQQFEMDSPQKAYPLYAECAALGIPVIVQCGLNWAPKAKIRDGNPLNLELAVIDNPSTNFIIAHLGWPWVNEATSLAMKYSNVYLDSSVVYSGTPAECLDHVINTTLGKHLFERNLINKVVYASSYPRADMRRTIRGIKKIGFSHHFLERFFYMTASKLLDEETI